MIRSLLVSARLLGPWITGAIGALTLSSCGGSTGAVGPKSGVPVGEFAVESVSVLEGGVWQLNRPIDVTFNGDVDFGTVSLSTVQIIDTQGVPAVGIFNLISPRVVRFQPACPGGSGDAAAGLLPGRNYRVIVPAQSSGSIGGGVTVQNSAGRRLDFGSFVSFRTPDSNDPLVLYVDLVAGPPSVRIRGAGDLPLDSASGSYVEFPGRPAPDDRAYFSFDAVTQLGGVEGQVPLNLYSDERQRFALVLEFNQPIDASPANVNSGLIGMQYLRTDPVTGAQDWARVPSRVELLSNCEEAGAAVRVMPLGIVPQGSLLRATLGEGFADLTGDRVPATLVNFAQVRSGLADPENLDEGARDDGVDEVLEHFSVGGDADGSLEATDVSSSNPRASWSAPSAPGILAGSFEFSGTGGPGGDFDWVIPINANVILSTDADTILGGPGGVPSSSQTVIGGIVQVRDLIVRRGATLSIIGSNTATILATGAVIVEGSIRVDGADNPGVGTLNTTNIPEFGAKGNAGGGDGGTASFRTSASTARGGSGLGAFGAPGVGGQGGETGFAPQGPCGTENRRGAGGGGGRLGEDIRFLWTAPSGAVALRLCQTLIGMDAEPGFIGSILGTGAVTQSGPPQGGAVGTSPFIDADDTNNFFGTALLASGELVRGELTQVWAGAGGGAGGDAARGQSFPMTPFSATGDEKGSGGGGGAGGLEILAIGDVRIAPDGSISADGGTGGGGENTIQFNRVGGGSGGGSGGHIVISSAGSIIIEAEINSDVVGPFYNDNDLAAIGAALIHEKRPLRALGGQGGAGRLSFCGANENGERGWAVDAIPFEAFEGDNTIPPQTVTSWRNACNRTNPNCGTAPPEGTLPGAGGDGGPGIIQLHVADPSTQLRFPGRPGVYGGTPISGGGGTVTDSVDPTYSMVPPPLGWSTPTAPVDRLLPFFSARSESFSDWIPLGLARVNPDGRVDEQVRLAFGGIDLATGEVLRDGTVAQELAPIVSYTALSVGGVLPSASATGPTISFAASSIDEVYRANPSLMAEFALRIRAEGGRVEEFLVQSARLESDTGSFTVAVDPKGDVFLEQLGRNGLEVELVPFFFRLEAGGIADAYPEGTSIKISFDAALVNEATGEPSSTPADVFSGGDVQSFTTDIGDLNARAWDFVRVKFEFDINAGGGGISQAAIDRARPGLSYFRIPYSY